MSCTQDHCEHHFLHEIVPTVFNMGQILLLIALLQLNCSGPLSGWCLICTSFLAIIQSKEHRQTTVTWRRIGAGGPLAAGMSLCSGVCHHRPGKSRAHQFCERERAWRGTPRWEWGRHQNGGEALKEIGLSAWKGPNHQLIQVGTRYRGVMPVLSSTAAIMANGTYRTGRNRYGRNCASGDSSNGKNNVCGKWWNGLEESEH